MQETIQEEQPKVNIAYRVLRLIGVRMGEQLLSIILLIFSNIIPSLLIHFGLVLLQTHLNFPYDLGFFDVWVGISIVELLIKTIF